MAKNFTKLTRKIDCGASVEYLTAHVYRDGKTKLFSTTGYVGVVVNLTGAAVQDAVDKVRSKVRIRNKSIELLKALEFGEVEQEDTDQGSNKCVQEESDD